MKTQALLTASQATTNISNQPSSSTSTDPIPSPLLPSQNNTTADQEHSLKYPLEHSHDPPTIATSVTSVSGALVLLYGFVCLDDIRDADEQNEVLLNVRDLMSPFGGVETGKGGGRCCCRCFHNNNNDLH